VTFDTDTVTGSHRHNVIIDSTGTSSTVVNTLVVTNGSYSRAALRHGFLISLSHAAVASQRRSRM